MSISIYIDYKLWNFTIWETIEISPEEYFDKSYFDGDLDDEEIQYDSLSELNHDFEYLNIDIKLISHTRLRVIDNNLNCSRTISTTFWNKGNNSIAKRIDIESGSIANILTVIVTKVSNNPPVWEILRIQEENNVPMLEFHSFITDQDDDTETEEIIYPIDN